MARPRGGYKLDAKRATRISLASKGKASDLQATPMDLKPGTRYTTCPSCSHEVRVVNAMFSDVSAGIRDKDPMIGNHTSDGAKYRESSKRSGPCQGSLTRPFRIDVK